MSDTAPPTDTGTQVDTNEDQVHHPGVGQYVEIGIILAIVTAMEVALYYIDIARAVAIPALLFLTALKFVLVVMWFMHLRFDSPWFRRVFVFGLVIAAVVFSITVSLFYFGGTTA